MGDVDLTDEQMRYVKERGFEQVEECPGSVGWFPYLAMCRGNLDEFDMLMYVDRRTVAGADLCSVGDASVKELADRVEEFVADLVICEREKMDTPRGEPFKVYVAEGAWQPVVDELVSRRQYQI